MSVLRVIKADCLFVASLDQDLHLAIGLPPKDVKDTVRATLKRHGFREVGYRVAEEYGACPDTASIRMALALAVVTDSYRRLAVSN